MDYRIEKRDAFQVVCRRKPVGKPQSGAATPDITALWQECGADGTTERLIASAGAPGDARPAGDLLFPGA